MITGIHAMFFTPGADALRPFIRDTLGIPATDTGDGVADLPAHRGEIGCHPDESVRHDVSFTCDDIEPRWRTSSQRASNSPPR